MTTWGGEEKEEEEEKEDVVEVTHVNVIVVAKWVTVVAVLPKKEYGIATKADAAKQSWQINCSYIRNKVKLNERRLSPHITRHTSHFMNHTSHTHHSS